ncbi:adenosine deaminase [Amycolatopsis sp. H20-H5]|uniref:adenosine deaminase n=1 Tax=Amycolatopsis sp. H20-H5 TaxID=3046309 RepID=UPI002DB6DD33|nr:adenosine deaminase [Amycolatopsis sp. H20-H5]MEC3976465.1 adenosine deaminase [Amycolatopsis sp. H20-H5]
MRDLTTLPKAHLHVHLESTIRPGTLREIGEANGVSLPGQAPVFDGFRAFADYNSLIRDCLRRPEDFERIAREFCEDEAAQGTRYAEVTFTAASHGERLGDLDLPLESVLKGLKAGGAAHGIDCRVLLDHSRRRSVDRARQTLDLARRHAADGVLGLGMAGEEKHSLTPFAAIFDEAREAGLHLVHHAGEDCGPPSIREALEIGHSERLGHGIRILEDPALVAEIRERGIALEVCPSSNVILGLVPSFAEHPLPRLVDAGLVVTVNTDVPSVTGTTLTDEYTRIRETFGYDDHALAVLAAAGVDASFASASTKTALHQGIKAWLG